MTPSTCAICQQPLRLHSETPYGNDWMRNYKCGHSFYETATRSLPIPGETRRNYASCSARLVGYDYQKEGVEFVFRNNFNCLIADRMGLGKTIQILLAAREAKFPDGTRRFKTILALVKSATTYQWMSEAKEWFDPALWSVFIMAGTKAFVPPGFSMYILSMDTFARFMKTPAGTAVLRALNIDLVIVDESHSFKDPNSARTQALITFIKYISVTDVKRELQLGCVNCGNSWTKPVTVRIDCRATRKKLNHYERGQCPQCSAHYGYAMEHTLDEKEISKGLVMLTGTPITNRAEEYAVPLELLRPDIFPPGTFKKRWLDQDPVTKKWNRIKSWKLEAFRELTKDFIIRRDEKDANLNLPPFRRTFEKIAIEDPSFKTAYNKALDILEQKVEAEAAKGKELSVLEMQDNLMVLRRIIGIAKVQFATEYTEEFLESVEDEKLAIGIHHEAVRDMLYFSLKQKGIKVLKLSGEDSAERKNQILEEFKNDSTARVLIINIIAGGTGLNIQVCNNALVLERQWNAATEEQFEKRFHRNGQKRPVQANYAIAAGLPVEDYFTAMVEEKRQICGETLDGWDFSNDKEALRDLISRSITQRIK